MTPGTTPGQGVGSGSPQQPADDLILGLVLAAVAFLVFVSIQVPWFERTGISTGISNESIGSFEDGIGTYWIFGIPPGYILFLLAVAMAGGAVLLALIPGDKMKLLGSGIATAASLLVVSLAFMERMKVHQNPRISHLEDGDGLWMAALSGLVGAGIGLAALARVLSQKNSVGSGRQRTGLPGTGSP